MKNTFKRAVDRAKLVLASGIAAFSLIMYVRAKAVSEQPPVSPPHVAQPDHARVAKPTAISQRQTGVVKAKSGNDELTRTHAKPPAVRLSSKRQEQNLVKSGSNGIVNREADRAKQLVSPDEDTATQFHEAAPQQISPPTLPPAAAPMWHGRVVNGKVPNR